MRGISTNAHFTWYYEKGDEDMFELGFILRSLIECPFTVVEVAEMNQSQYEKIITGTLN
jgi:hypothetical protein